MSYQYKCATPELSPDAISPVMNNEQMENWLNKMSDNGWEFVGHAQKHWTGYDPFIQDWWIFKKEKSE